MEIDSYSSESDPLEDINSSAVKNPKRTKPNLEEHELLLVLIKKYRLDKISNEDDRRSVLWYNLTDEFNLSCAQNRTTRQIKKIWRNHKQNMQKNGNEPGLKTMMKLGTIFGAKESFTSEVRKHLRELMKRNRLYLLECVSPSEIPLSTDVLLNSTSAFTIFKNQISLAEEPSNLKPLNTLIEKNESISLIAENSGDLFMTLKDTISNHNHSETVSDVSNADNNSSREAQIQQPIKLHISSDESNKNSVSTSTKRKKRIRNWRLSATYNSKEEAVDAVKKEIVWSYHYDSSTFEGRKSYYRCNVFKKRGKQCDAGLYILYCSNDVKTIVFKTEEGHSHEGLEVNTNKLNYDIKDKIKSYFDLNIKPKKMMEILATQGVTIKKTQLNNYLIKLRHQRKKENN